MLLKILRPLERLSTELAFVWLQWYMHTNVRCDVVALHCGSPTCAPRTSQAEVVRALSSDVDIAEMVLYANTK